MPRPKVDDSAAQNAARFTTTKPRGAGPRVGVLIVAVALALAVGGLAGLALFLLLGGAL